MGLAVTAASVFGERNRTRDLVSVACSATRRSHRRPDGSSSEESIALFQGLAAVGTGVGNNYLVKSLAGTSTAELALLRCAGLVIVLLPVVVWRGGVTLTRAMLLRALVEAIATLLLLESLMALSLSVVATVMMIIPIAAMLVGGLVQGEAIAPRSRLLIIGGFVGTTIAIGPISIGSPAAVATALAAAAGYVIRDTITRTRARRSSSVDLAFTANLATATVAVLWFLHNSQPSSIDVTRFGAIAGMIVLYVISNLLIVSATRGARMALAATTRYSAILWALLFDVTLLHALPSRDTLVGAGIVVACGIALVLSESRRKRVDPPDAL